MPFHRRAQPAEAVSAPAAPPTHFVELRDVCKYYQMGTVRISAADHINFYIEKGEFCVIVGPSGAGKTTVLNCWAAWTPAMKAKFGWTASL